MKIKIVLQRVVGVLAIVGISFGIGMFVQKNEGKQTQAGPQHSEVAQSQPASDGANASKAATLWTCSMHPQIKMPKPGKCPLCGMTLIPLKSQGGDDGTATLSMSENAKKLAEIEVTQVEQKFVTTEVRMVGKLTYDERRVNTLSAWVAGRIDNLYVDYTGIRVSKHDHLAFLYSPELFTAQEELLEAKRRVNENSLERSPFLKKSNQRTYESAREKLRLWGLPYKEIDAIEASAKTSDHITIYAPDGGVVVEKFVSEGDYVKTGSKLFTIADLSKLWLQMDAYESDLAYLHYAQEVEITTEAYPGETFYGTIAFINPELDERSRTVKVRVNVDNTSLKLKPEMFVRAVVYSRLGQGGKVISPTLAGKWIGPMHPEVVKDHPGKCDICGMALVRAEDYGYTTNQKEVRPIVVPATAVLKTGRRAVVYVELKGKKLPTYQGREIMLGHRAGAYYVVDDGLKPGEWVVVNGNFKIDSALQILAKPSMMNIVKKRVEMTVAKRTEKRRESLKVVSRSEIKRKLKPLYSHYFAFQSALATDDLAAAKKHLTALQQATKKIKTVLFVGDSKTLWQELSYKITKEIPTDTNRGELESLRQVFKPISQAVIEIAHRFGHQRNQTFFLMRCPMVKANWLQLDRQVQNPFYGTKMPTCGVLKERITSYMKLDGR